MIKAGIIGATGYAGNEIVRLLLGHKDVEVAWYGSRSYIDQKYSDVYQNFFKLVDAKCMDDNMEALADEVDVIFTATPQGLCASLINEGILSKAKVIDLSADFRIKDVKKYEKWYGIEHKSPQFIDEAVYGLCEINREDIAFLLWTLSSKSSDSCPFNDVENPLGETLLELADVLYERLDAAFESAPISDELASNWMMDRRLMEKEREPLPEIVPGAALPTDVELFLEAGKGEPLMFFDSYDALKFFFVHSLKWEDDEETLLPELAEFDNFVVYGNPKGVLVAPDVAKYFAAGNNPLYDAATTEEEAYEMFCEGGLCPFDLLKYGMEHNLLPEAQFPFENGKALLHDNWDFVARWFLREFYEGD